MIQAINKTRDEIPGHGIATRREHRWISLDFNDDGDPAVDVAGIEVKIPDDITASEEYLAKRWVSLTHAFFLSHGHEVPIRRGDGLKRGGRGVSNTFHLEPSFADDVRALRLIMCHSAEYCALMIASIGQITNGTFILPHKSRDPGKVSDEGYSERELARHCLMPHLLRYTGAAPEVYIT